MNRPGMIALALVVALLSIGMHNDRETARIETMECK